MCELVVCEGVVCWVSCVCVRVVCERVVCERVVCKLCVCVRQLFCVWETLNQRVYKQGAIPRWMANEKANDESCKRTCELPTSDMARWLSHRPPIPT